MDFHEPQHGLQDLVNVHAYLSSRTPDRFCRLLYCKHIRTAPEMVRQKRISVKSVAKGDTITTHHNLIEYPIHKRCEYNLEEKSDEERMVIDRKTEFGNAKCGLPRVALGRWSALQVCICVFSPESVTYKQTVLVLHSVCQISVRPTDNST